MHITGKFPIMHLWEHHILSCAWMGFLIGLHVREAFRSGAKVVLKSHLFCSHISLGLRTFTLVRKTRSFLSSRSSLCSLLTCLGRNFIAFECIKCRPSSAEVSNIGKTLISSFTDCAYLAFTIRNFPMWETLAFLIHHSSYLVAFIVTSYFLLGWC